MEFRPRRVSPKIFALTESETAALRQISTGEIIHPLVCQKLRKLGLVEQNTDRWNPTRKNSADVSRRQMSNSMLVG